MTGLIFPSIFVLFFCLLILSNESYTSTRKEKVDLSIPKALSPFIEKIKFDKLGDIEPAITINEHNKTSYQIKLTFEVKDTINQNDWQLTITPAFTPTFHWAPHLTPTDEHIIDQHSFRSPALIVSSNEKLLTLIPDLDIMKQGTPSRWYMDLDAQRNLLTIGMSEYEVNEHVLYVRKPGAAYPPGKVQIGFYLFVSQNKKDIENPWRKPLAFLWEKWGKPLYQSGQPIAGNLEPYIKHTYNWAFNTWKENVWQEFELNGKKVGAPGFIVNVTQSPNYPGPINEREFRSIWNQAWFSSLRSASGLYRYARRINDDDLMNKARMTKELALLAPMKQGFFPSVIATEMEFIEIDGKKYNHSKGWETAFWGNSNRNPITRDPKLAPLHILDMSWTTLLMLRWYDELEKDERLVNFATKYAESLLKLQDEKGFFPGWLDNESLKPIGILDDSPETSMSVTFLLKIAQITSEQKYQQAALKAMDAVMNEITPTGRWEDFETYWSCCGFGKDHLVGKKVARNNMYKQNTFSMFWTTKALFECYKATVNRKFLNLGQRVLDELLMAQASWQPPYMYVNVLGGFSVMNCDGEWLDSRESLFAEIIIKYGLELGIEEYIQRGLAALRSAFVMMYCPENPKTKAQWEKKHVFFGPEDYGFTMENYAHIGVTSAEGIGMGSFTIYDWGNGAAAEAYNRLVDHYGIEFVQRK